MTTITTGAAGLRAPRISKNQRSSDQYSRSSITPRATSTTTARAAAMPGT